MVDFKTPEGYLSFPNLFKPRTAPGSTEAKYSASLLFDAKAQKHPAFLELKKACEDLAKERFPKARPGTIRMPFRDGDEKAEDYEQYAGMVFINPTSKNKPKVLNIARQEILDEQDVWPGQKARFLVAPFAYDTNGNKGVSLGLNGVQIVKEDMPRWDGRSNPESAFDDGEYAEADDAPF